MVKCLLHNHEDQSPDSQHSHSSRAQWPCCNPGTVELLNSLPSSGSGLTEKAHTKNKGKNTKRRQLPLPSDLHTYMMHAGEMGVRTSKCTQHTHISTLHRQTRIKYLYKVLIIKDTNINISWLSLGTEITGDQVVYYFLFLVSV